MTTDTTEAGEPALDELLDFEPEPLELIAEEGPGPLRRLLSLKIVLPVLLIVFGTAGWLKREQWSAIPAYQPVYQWLCEQVDCGLAAPYQLELISASQLVIRHHPDKQGILAVDLILTNKAEKAQAFPNFVVEFSDIDERVISRETFVPGQYLRGDLAGTSTMSAGQPVHINLELTDPGSHAVNYQIELLPPG